MNCLLRSFFKPRHDRFVHVFKALEVDDSDLLLFLFRFSLSPYGQCTPTASDEHAMASSLHSLLAARYLSMSETHRRSLFDGRLRER